MKTIEPQIQSRSRSLFTAATVAALMGFTATATQAATIGHWNFEAESLTDADAGPNNLKLTTLGSGVTRVESPFPDPIPRTGAANEWAASFGGSGNLETTETAASKLGVQSFTIEAFIRADVDANSNMYISSRWKSSGRSWALGRAGATSTTGGTSRGLFLLVSGNGTETHILGSGLVLNQGDQYYVGASFNGTSETDDVTFYLQNLTDGGSLQSVTISSGRISTNNPATGPIQIGSFSDQSSRWTGLIDEVRLSSEVLSENQLLIIPEPGTYAALAGLMALGLAAVRRRRRA